MSTSVPRPQFFPEPQMSAADEAAGRACYEAFAEAMSPWMPYPANWPEQAATVKRAWVAAAAAAKAARKP